VAQGRFGPNEWLVDEIFQQYLADRDSVAPAWWDFFADYSPADGSALKTSIEHTNKPSANGAAATVPTPTPAIPATADSANGAAATSPAPTPSPAPASAEAPHSAVVLRAGGRGRGRGRG